MASAEPVTTDDLSADERDALEALLLRLADDEFVLAERYTEWQVRSPTLESDLALSNNAQDELGHARLWYDVLEDLGYEEHELIYEREADAWRHSTLVERPFPGGDWADAIVRHYLYDVAEKRRLEALEDSAYPKLADRVGKIQAEERYHLEHAQNWMERLADDDADDGGRERLQQAVDRLFPYALTLFAPVDDETEATIEEAGFRDATLEELATDWASEVVPFLEGLGLDVPIGEDDVLDLDPDVPRGRDGDHTDVWADLREEFTSTYRELGRSGATKIMEKPE
ncbi:1,2-phenylacetyl-CoA epoxidase subunit PaaC [Saliphagus sp. GCM10025308]